MDNIILDNQDATLWYYPDSKIIHHQIKRYVFGTALQTILNTGTALMEQYGAEKWLSDDSLNNALNEQDQEWAFKVWLPKTVRLGWRFWAIVQPKSITGKTNMRRHSINVAKRGVKTATFSNVAEAMIWLKYRCI